MKRDEKRELSSHAPSGLNLVGRMRPNLHEQRCPCQYRSHRAACPPRTIAHDMSPPFGDMHQAPVRLPPAEPVEMQRIVGPCTKTWPCSPVPVGLPMSETKALRASIAVADGQGCPGLQEPSISRAAIPERRMRGPSSHHTGPSPSQTAAGVQSNACPEGTAAAARNRTSDIALTYSSEYLSVQ